MNYMLDTDTCIALIRQQLPILFQKVISFQPGEIGLSTITVAELQYGVERSQYRERNEAALTQFLLPFEIADFDSTSALTYGRVRAELEACGTPIGALDTLIAAQALTLKVNLVTNNLREFRRVKGLDLENWL
ncbi:MAG: type II toxin-antitoxin system VapC family toxin [Anaerolineales bacterium]|jgi:tRNA(fMet)-specific endonuclease VapC